MILSNPESNSIFVKYGDYLCEMIQRDAASKILELAEKFPAIGLLGPRQSGKTTLAKNLFSDKPYVSFENQDTLLAASTDPRAFCIDPL